MKSYQDFLKANKKINTLKIGGIIKAQQGAPAPQQQQGGGSQEEMQQQLVEMIMQGLQQNVPEEQIVQAISQKFGIEPEQAQQIIAQVKQQAQGGAQ